jgi:hypothetical protein
MFSTSLDRSKEVLNIRIYYVYSNQNDINDKIWAYVSDIIDLMSTSDV